MSLKTTQHLVGINPSSARRDTFGGHLQQRPGRVMSAVRPTGRMFAPSYDRHVFASLFFHVV
jgi:hypothetical protein